MKFITLLLALLISQPSTLFAENRVELDWDHFISEPSDPNGFQLQDYVSARARYNLDHHFQSFALKGSAIGEFFLDGSKQIYFTMPELYMAYTYKFNRKDLAIESLDIFLGRKKHDWSVSDEYWGFGLWQPLNRWNPLHPESNGLMGTFLSIKGGYWSIDTLVGGLYFPSNSPNSRVKNGDMVSSSRWFVRVPQKADILGHSLLDIRYFIEKPFILDIIFQQSYIMSFKAWLEHNLWMKFVLGYKPVNDFFVLQSNSIKIEVAESVVEQKFTVAQVKHKIFSTEWGLNYGPLSSVISVGSTFVKEVQDAPKDWEFRYDRGSFTYFSALLQYSFSKNHYFLVSYLDSWFEAISEEEDNDKTPFIFDNYKVLKGFGLNWHLEYKNKESLKRMLDIHYKYAFLSRGGMLSIQGSYYFAPQFYMAASFDVLGARSGDKYFLSKFRANDYLSWKIGYVF